MLLVTTSEGVFEVDTDRSPMEWLRDAPLQVSVVGAWFLAFTAVDIGPVMVRVGAIDSVQPVRPLNVADVSR